LTIDIVFIYSSKYRATLKKQEIKRKTPPRHLLCEKEFTKSGVFAAFGEFFLC